MAVMLKLVMNTRHVYAGEYKVSLVLYIMTGTDLKLGINCQLNAHY